MKGREEKRKAEKRAKGQEIPRREGSYRHSWSVNWNSYSLLSRPIRIRSKKPGGGADLTLEKTQADTLSKQLDKNIICHRCRHTTLLHDTSEICKQQPHTKYVSFLFFPFFGGGGVGADLHPHPHTHTCHERNTHATFSVVHMAKKQHSMLAER